MTAPPVIREIVPKSGLLFQEISLHPVLCKPKIMPLKSVTLEKLEKMQKQAQDKAMEMEKAAAVAAGVRPQTRSGAGGEGDIVDQPAAARSVSAISGGGKADVWRADEDATTGGDADED